MDKRNRKSLRDRLIVKLGGMTKAEWKAEFDRHIIKVEAPVEKLTVTWDVDNRVVLMGDALPHLAKGRLMEKLAHDLIESDIVKVESYELEPNHIRYVATLHICRVQQGGDGKHG